MGSGKERKADIGLASLREAVAFHLKKHGARTVDLSSLSQAQLLALLPMQETAPLEVWNREYQDGGKFPHFRGVRKFRRG